MRDNLNERRPRDSNRVSTGEEWEIQYWTKALGCSEAQLKAAIKAVGNSAVAIRQYLEKDSSR
jgi:hypothetical protein